MRPLRLRRPPYARIPDVWQTADGRYDLVRSKFPAARRLDRQAGRPPARDRRPVLVAHRLATQFGNETPTPVAFPTRRAALAALTAAYAADG